MGWPTEVPPSGFDWEVIRGPKELQDGLNPGWYNQVFEKAFF